MDPAATGVVVGLVISVVAVAVGTAINYMADRNMSLNISIIH